MRARRGGMAVAASLLVAGLASAQEPRWPSEGPPRPLAAHTARIEPTC